MGVVVDIALANEQLGVVIARKQERNGGLSAVGSGPFGDGACAIVLLVAGVEVLGCRLIMSGEAVGRRQAEVVVVDVDGALAAEHEAIGHTVVHDAQHQLAVGTQRDGGFVVVLIDGGELQGHHRQEAVLHAARLAHRHTALGQRLFAEIQGDVAECVDDLSVFLHCVAQLTFCDVQLNDDRAVGRGDGASLASCKHRQGGDKGHQKE